MTMVGDAYAAPLVEELNRRTYELSSLYAIGTGGAATNPKHVSALLEKLPQLTIINGYGSSETGNMGFGHSQRGSAPRDVRSARRRHRGVRGLTRFLAPGTPRSDGWCGPAGFRWATSTMPMPPARPSRWSRASAWSSPGDRASLEADGTLRLFGRDSLVVNTGGEKVFVEEVEEVLRAHPGVADALVVGRDSERWGQEIVALVEAACRARRSTPEALHAACTAHLARFKAPKEYHLRRQGPPTRQRQGRLSVGEERSGVRRCELTRNHDCSNRAIDCLVNVHFGETAKQPEFMLKVRDDYFKGPKSLYDQVELPAAARRDGRARRRQGHPDGQPRQAVGDGAQVRRGTAGQVRVWRWAASTCCARCRRCASWRR